ncbi:MAG: hypothetical protein UH080_04505 [Ruminococcus sp.]|nr:hypothetical protein [Ruminococcus sp.]
MGKRKFLNAKFKKEEKFSEYIKDKMLQRICEIIGKPIKSDTALLEQKKNYEDFKGTLRVDILAESVEGTYIAIENQFFLSNHDHFGKLFTYATMFGSEEKPVTDIVWIVEKVHKEHYEAVNIINNLLKEKDVNFKIWLLIAKLDDNDEVVINEPLNEDFFKWGDKLTNDPKNKIELDQFMPELMKHIRVVLSDWNEPKRASTTSHCITVTNRSKPYNLNIAFRTAEDKFKIEAIFNKHNQKHKEHYKSKVPENWDAIIEGLEDYSFNQIIQEYDIDYAIEKTYVKICGLFIADIENINNWQDYIDKAITLLLTIVEISDMVPRY